MTNANLRLTHAEQKILDLIKNGQVSSEIELQHQFDLLTQDWQDDDKHRFGILFRCFAATIEHLNRVESAICHPHVKN